MRLFAAARLLSKQSLLSRLTTYRPPNFFSNLPIRSLRQNHTEHMTDNLFNNLNRLTERINDLKSKLENATGVHERLPLIMFREPTCKLTPTEIAKIRSKLDNLNNKKGHIEEVAKRLNIDIYYNFQTNQYQKERSESAGRVRPIITIQARLK